MDSVKAINLAPHQTLKQSRGNTMTPNPKLNTQDLKAKTILLMTTAPPEKDTWYHGKRLPPIGLNVCGCCTRKSGFYRTNARQLPDE